MRAFPLLLVLITAASRCPAAGLTIANAALSTSDGGESIAASHHFLTGETVYFTFQASGCTKKTDDDERDHIQLEYSVTANDKAGVLLDKPLSGKISEELTPQDKNWLPKVHGSFVLPDTLFTGEYQLQIEIHDLIANTSAKSQLKFLATGSRKQKSAHLTVDELHFFRDEEGRQPVSKPAYHPGDAIHVRFQIVGFTLKELNSYHVSYGIKVLRADRTLVFEQPQAASEKDRTFYPRGYLTGTFNFSLDKKNALGTYHMVVELRDDFSGQKQITEFPFILE